MLLQCIRKFGTSHSCSKKAVILGINTKSKDSKTDEDNVSYPTGTPMYNHYNEKLKGSLTTFLKSCNQLKTGQAKTFYNLLEEGGPVIAVGVGSSDDKTNILECLDEKKENVRKAVGAGMKQLENSGVDEVGIDSAGLPCAAAEGAFLSSWSYKKSNQMKFPSLIGPLKNEDSEQWKVGKVYAEAQNWSRHLMDSPANIMTPTNFASEVCDVIGSCETAGRVRVHTRRLNWIQDQKMGAFLSVAQGSEQEPMFVEVHYDGPGSTANERPLVLVGKGITFDSGGISIKPSQDMHEMRGDMGGAATMVGAILACARLNSKGRIIGLFPLCENLINGKATKPGDVVTARNGVTIQVDNTDAEGRLLLVDALSYAQDLNPAAVINAATLTGAMMVALGSSASGLFTNNENLWKQFSNAGFETGDRVWRMPLFNHYSNQIKPSHLADINNVGKGGRYGGACTAAAFLRHFIKPDIAWAHLDIASVMASNGNDVPYLSSGMSGRPTRTIAHFARHFENAL